MVAGEIRLKPRREKPQNVKQGRDKRFPHTCTDASDAATRPLVVCMCSSWYMSNKHMDGPEVVLTPFYHNLLLLRQHRFLLQTRAADVLTRSSRMFRLFEA